MAVAEQLWHASQDLAIACLNHPFIQGIADGTLTDLQFSYYVGQDAFFLDAFARAYSIAAAKAPDRDTFEIFHGLAWGVLEELKLHEGYATQWSLDLKTIKPGATTRRYTDFLLATAWSQDVGVITCAMLPCMRLYAFLGEKLAVPGIPDHAYADWIKTYSSPEFGQLADQLTRLVNRYGFVNQACEEVYDYAMQCELDFFETAWLI